MITYTRFPQSLPFVVIDMLERAYLCGFALLQVLITLFPLISTRFMPTARLSGNASACVGDNCAGQSHGGTSAMEFLPLMMTSVYCALGLVWAFLRLSVLYLTK